MQLKKMFILIFVFFAFFSIKAEEDINNNAVKELLLDSFKFKLGKTLDEVKKNLGKPESTKVEGYVVIGEKIYEAGKFYTLTYDGIEVEIYDYHETNEQFITRVSITKTKYSLKNKISVGKAKDVVLEALGTDTEWEDESEVSYALDIEDDNELKEKYKNIDSIKLTFKLSDNKIEEIVFLYDCNYVFGGDRIEVE